MAFNPNDLGPRIALIPGNMRKGMPIQSPLPAVPLVGKKGKPVPWNNPDVVPMLPDTVVTAKFIDGIPSGRNEINKVLSAFRKADGYAVPNRFEVYIFPPPKAGISNQSAAVQMRCEDVTLPGRNLNSKTDTLTYGPTREIVDGVTYAEDITLTFQASSGLDERVFFENWQETAFSRTTWDVGYYDDYKGTIEIFLLDKQNRKRYGLKLMEAFPKTIGPIPLSQSANNQIVKNTVTFSFRYWETSDTNRQVGTGSSPGFGSTSDFGIK